MVQSFTEYSPINKSTVFPENEELWKELESYVEYLMKRASSMEIEDKPSLGWGEKGRLTNMKSYIGEYSFFNGTTLKFAQDMNKLPSSHLKKMLKDIVNWSFLQGSPFVSSVLRFVNGDIKSNPALALSSIVRQLSNAILSGYMPPSVERRTYVGPEQTGPLELSKTMKRVVSGRNEYVSVRTRLRPDSLPLLLLLRFNAEMAGAMASLAEDLREYKDILPKRSAEEWKRMHMILSHSGRSPTALETALDTDFEEPRTQLILEKELKTTELQSLRKAWLAYRAGAVPEAFIEDDFSGLLGNGLRPLSKLYEVWCYAQVIQSLDVLDVRWLNRPQELTDVIVGRTAEGRRIRVHFQNGANTAFLNSVNVIFSHNPRPDIVVDVSKLTKDHVIDHTIIFDAKYRLKGQVNYEDLKSLLWYSACFSHSTRSHLECVILHLNPDGKSSQELVKRFNPETTVHMIGLQPNPEMDGESEQLRTLFRNAL